MEEVGRFRFTKIWSVIHGADGAAGMEWLSINKELSEWVDVEEDMWMVLEVWGKGCGQIFCEFCLLLIGGATVVLMQWGEDVCRSGNDRISDPRSIWALVWACSLV